VFTLKRPRKVLSRKSSGPAWTALGSSRGSEKLRWIRGVERGRQARFLSPCIVGQDVGLVCPCWPLSGPDEIRPHTKALGCRTQHRRPDEGWHSPMIRMFVRDVVPFTDSKTEERRKRRRSHFSGALMAPRAGAQPVRGRAGIFCEPSSKPVTAGLGAESSAFFFLSFFLHFHLRHPRHGVVLGCRGRLQREAAKGVSWKPSTHTHKGERDHGDERR